MSGSLLISDIEAGVQTRELVAGTAAGALTLGGLAATFGLASCCALPLLLTSLGLSAAWRAGITAIAVEHRGILFVVGALSLIGGAIFLWRQQRVARTCGPDGVCTPPAVRLLTLIGLAVGAGLFWAGWVYA